MINPDAKPITIFSLLQVAIILLGILGAGMTSRFLRDAMGDEPLPPITLFVLNRGIILCLIPIVWAAVTAHVRTNIPNAGIKGTILLLAGPIIAVALAVFMLGATLLQLGATYSRMPE